MFLVLFAAVFLLFLIYEVYWKRRNFPPGPCPLPLFGNLLSLNSPPPGYEAFSRWTKEFGDVYTFWIGNTPHIMVNSYEKLKETFVREGDVYVDKKLLTVRDLFRGGEYGIVDTNGATWREHRRFTLTCFRDFGLGKNLMQEKILIEVADVFKKLDECEDSEIDITIIFHNAIANVINQLVLGYRFDETRQEEFKGLKKILDDLHGLFGKFHMFLAMNISFVRRIMPYSIFEKPIIDFRESAFNYFNAQIEKHKKEIEFAAEGEDCQDYVEAFLKEQIKREAEGDNETFSTRQLVNMCMDLWFAGLGTTITTISWAIGYVLNNPEVQDKLHEELNRVIASDRLVTTADKQDLPYMNAFINESQRCVNLAPLNFPHATTKDTVINGYFIPKGTGVIAQISTVMNDEKTFKNSKVFNPDRFIDENGRLKKVEELIPFSIGKRQCMGEGLAKMELFLFLANFFNRYEVYSSKSNPPVLEKNSGSVVAPLEFKAKVIRKRL